MGHRLHLPSRLWGIWGNLSPASARRMLSPALPILRQRAGASRACVFWLMCEKRFRCHCVLFTIAPVKATIVCQCPKSLCLPQTSSEEDHSPAGPIVALAQLRPPQGTAVCPMPFLVFHWRDLHCRQDCVPHRSSNVQKNAISHQHSQPLQKPHTASLNHFFSSRPPARSRALSTGPGVDGSSCCPHLLREAYGHIFLSHPFLLLLTDLIAFQPVLFFFCSIVMLRIVTLDQNFIASNETVSQEGRNLHKSENAMGCLHDFWMSAWPS